MKQVKHRISGQTYACKILDKTALLKMRKPGASDSQYDKVLAAPVLPTAYIDINMWTTRLVYPSHYENLNQQHRLPAGTLCIRQSGICSVSALRHPLAPPKGV